jgi:hypothetical protein
MKYSIASNEASKTFQNVTSRHVKVTNLYSALHIVNVTRVPGGQNKETQKDKGKKVRSNK